MDGRTAERELGIAYRSFRECVGSFLGYVVRKREEDVPEAVEFVSGNPANLISN